MMAKSTRIYGLYFRSEWLEKGTQWAATFRSGAMLATNNNMVESWHSQVKCVSPRRSHRPTGCCISMMALMKYQRAKIARRCKWRTYGTRYNAGTIVNDDINHDKHIFGVQDERSKGGNAN